ncbi:ABC transporter substrate-binding protein [uncultured Microbacterium sp.]|uniref:ABC transporter substrate-binding protein n=1 Tax=uncultured Microbacterium sp. TaxID=191216 RepID=UPI00260B8612|nr:ABC transporter substrate-binding protein [uncultured Microbacterium sp.]
MLKSTLRRGVLASVAVAVPAVLVLAGCSASASAPEPTAAAGAEAPLFSQLPTDVQKAGVIEVASNVEYPPFESFDTDGKTVIGIDRDIADELEKQLGVKLNFNHISFDAIIPGLTGDRYKLAMSAMSDTVERQQQVDFLDYFNAGGSIMLPPNTDGSVKTLADLCGKEAAVVQGTTEVDDAASASEKCVADGKQPIKSTIYPGQSQAVLAVQNGRADAGLFDYTAASYVAAQSKAGLTVLPPYQAGPFGIVFPKNSALIPVFQKALVAVEKSGRYLEILKKYQQDGGAVTEFAINGTK